MLFRESLSQILLISFFNDAQYIDRVAPWISKLYSTTFADILIVCDDCPRGNSFRNSSTHNLPVMCIKHPSPSGNGGTGYDLFVLLASSPYSNRSYEGYVVMGDDGILFPWNLQSLDATEPILLKSYPKVILQSRQDWKWGKPYCDSGMSLVKTQNPSLYTLPYTRGGGGVADFYYLPIAYLTAFARLARAFSDSKIYMECCLAGMMDMVSSERTQSMSRVVLLWDKERKEPRKHIHDDTEFIHPVKIASDELTRDFIAKIFCDHGVASACN